jgi:Patatin-like phospholipase
MKKILSINGGGIKGSFAVSFLASLEDLLKRPIVDYFDLIVGTSTGGIIALGLGLGISSKDLLSFYQEHGDAIFPKKNFMSFFKRIFSSKFDQNSLRKALHESFQDKKLGDSKKRLIIPSMSLETGDVYLYKTAHHSRFEYDYKISAVDVALATSAAPTFFPIHKIEGSSLVDGGIWANNPTDLAIIEGISVLGWERSKIKVLNLGCTSTPFDMGTFRNSEKNVSSGIFPWFKGLRLLDLMSASQEAASLLKSYTLIGRENLVHINPIVPKGRYSLDNAKEVKSLIGLGKEEARKATPKLREIFFQEIAEEFVPLKKI